MLAQPITSKPHPQQAKVRFVVSAPVTRPQAQPPLAAGTAVIERFDSDFIDLIPTEFQEVLFVCNKHLPHFSDGTNIIKLLDSYRRHGSVWEITVNDKHIGITKYADQALIKAMEYMQAKGLVA